MPKHMKMFLNVLPVGIFAIVSFQPAVGTSHISLFLSRVLSVLASQQVKIWQNTAFGSKAFVNLDKIYTCIINNIYYHEVKSGSVIPKYQRQNGCKYTSTPTPATRELKEVYIVIYIALTHSAVKDYLFRNYLFMIVARLRYFSQFRTLWHRSKNHNSLNFSKKI